MFKFLSRFFNKLFGRNHQEVIETERTEPMFPAVNPPISQIVSLISRPTVPCRVVGKHHVVVGNNGTSEHYKVLGQISKNGVARIRPFGHRGIGTPIVMCQLSQE